MNEGDISALITMWDNEEFVLFHWATVWLVKQFELSRGVVERTLRELCAKGDIRSVHYTPMDEDIHPRPIKPSEWRNNEPDMDGTVFEAIAISQNDLNHWIGQQKPGEDNKITTPKRNHVHRIVKDLWPQRPPSELTNKAIVKLVRDRLTADCEQKNLPLSEVSDDTILRAAGRK